MDFFFQAEDGIRFYDVTGVRTCALPISSAKFAAFREFERDRLVLRDLREAAKPESHGVARSFAVRAAQAGATEWEMRTAAVGAAAGTRKP